MQTRNKDLIKPTLLQLTEQYKKSPNANAALDALCRNTASGPDMNLLLYIVSESKNYADAKSCLKLIGQLAANEKTDIKKLIGMLTAYAYAPDQKMNAGAYITTKFNHKIIERYLKVLDTIAHRDDVNADDLRKLIGEHSQYNQQSDKTVAHNLAHWNFRDTDLLKQYLTTLLYLAKNKKIDTETIWDALRKPRGAENNIGTMIVKQHHKPECIFLLTQLLDHLNATQVELLMPHNYTIFCNFLTKEALRDHIKTLPLDEQVAACNNALTEGSALNKIFMFRRGSEDCSPDKGTLKDLAATLGMAVNALDKQDKGITAAAARQAPLPSAPPLSMHDSENIALFDKAPPPENAEIPAVEFMGLSKKELGERLRSAAFNGNNEIIRQLLQNGADVNYHVDSATNFVDGSPLYMAAQEGKLDTVALLLQHGANYNLCRRNNMGPLAAAAYSGHAAIASLLLSKGADTTNITREKNSPLMFAAKFGHAEVIHTIIAHMITHIAHEDLLAFMQRDNHFLTCVEKAKNAASLLALLTFIDHLQALKINPEIINSLLPNTYTFDAFNIKELIVAHIKTLGIQERIQLCNQALDRNTPLGRFMYMSRGLTNVKPGHGTLGELEKLRDEAQNITEILINKCLNGTTQDVLSLLAIDGINLDARGAQKYTVLIAAAQAGKTDVARELLKRGANTTLGLAISRAAIIDGIKGYSKETRQRFETMLKEDEKKNNFVLMPEKLAELFGRTEIASLIRTHQEQLAQAAAAPAQQPVAVFVPPAVLQAPVFSEPYPLASDPAATTASPPAPQGFYEVKPIEYQSEPLLHHASAPRSEDVVSVTVVSSQTDAAPTPTAAGEVTAQIETATVDAAAAVAEVTPSEPAPVAVAEPAAQPEKTETENAEQKLYPAIPQPSANSFEPTQQYVDSVRARHPEAFVRDLIDFSQVSEPAPQRSALELLFDFKPEAAPAPRSQPTSSTALLIDFMSDIPAVAQTAPAPVEQLISFDFVNAPVVEEKKSGYSAATLMELGLFASAPEVVATPAPALTEDENEAEAKTIAVELPSVPKHKVQQKDTAPKKEKKAARKEAFAQFG